MKRGRGNDHEKPPPPKRTTKPAKRTNPMPPHARLGTPVVMGIVVELFNGHQSPIQGFDQFLPDGYQIQTLEKPVPPQIPVRPFIPMHVQTGTYHPITDPTLQNYPSHLPSPYLFQPNPIQPSPYGSSTYGSSTYDSSTYYSSTHDSYPYNSSRYPYQHHAMPIHLPSQSYQPPMHQSYMPVSVDRLQFQSPAHEEQTAFSQPPTFLQPNKSSSRLFSSGSRFAVDSNIETILYEDALYSILSFLTIQTLSSSMRVSHTFAKNAQQARKNTRTLTVQCTTHQEDFVKSVLTHCNKIQNIWLSCSLSKAQTYTILRHFADTIVHVSNGQLGSVCVDSPSHGYLDFPVGCDDFFLSFFARTLKNLKIIQHVGCFKANDLLYVARNCCTLEKCHLIRENQFHAPDINICLHALKTILIRNPHLYDLGLDGFVGVGEMILKLPESLHLEWLTLDNCNTSPETKKKLAEKFPNLYALDCSEEP